MTAWHTHTLTIASGQVYSNVLDMSSTKLLGVLLPSSFQGARLRVAAAAAPDDTFYCAK